MYGGTGFELKVPSYYSDDPTKVRLNNYIKKSVGLSEDGWEIGPSLYAPYLAVNSVVIGGVAHTGQNKVLWSGGLWMDDTDTVTLSSKVSEMPHGIVLVWSACNLVGNQWTPQDWGFDYTFIPKYHVSWMNGKGINITMGNNQGEHIFLPPLFVSPLKRQKLS